MGLQAYLGRERQADMPEAIADNYWNDAVGKRVIQPGGGGCVPAPVHTPRREYALQVHSHCTAISCQYSL